MCSTRRATPCTVAYPTGRAYNVKTYLQSRTKPYFRIVSLSRVRHFQPIYRSLPFNTTTFAGFGCNPLAKCPDTRMTTRTTFGRTSHQVHYNNAYNVYLYIRSVFLYNVYIYYLLSKSVVINYSRSKNVFENL